MSGTVDNNHHANNSIDEGETETDNRDSSDEPNSTEMTHSQDLSEGTETKATSENETQETTENETEETIENKTQDTTEHETEEITVNEIENTTENKTQDTTEHEQRKSQRMK